MRSDTRTLVLLAVETAVLEVAKRALDFLPNVELITFLFIVFTLKTGVKKTLIVSLIFSFIEMMIFGIGTWTMVYFYIWPILILAVHFLPENSGRLTYAVRITPHEPLPVISSGSPPARVSHRRRR